MQDHRRLEIWHRSMDYVVAIYRFSADLPDEERYNLVAQLRRAATSVPLNIAEGAASSSQAEFARFLTYAYRSLKEVTTCLELCQRLFPTTLGQAAEALDEGDQLARMIHALAGRLPPTSKSQTEQR